MTAPAPSRSRYFDSPGPGNTEEVLEAVAERVGSGRYEAVIIASTSGLTALKFARAVKGIKIVCVSEPPSYGEIFGRWPTLNEDYRQELGRLGVEILDRAPFVFHKSADPCSREAVVRDFMLRCLGNGFKVAVEIILMATSAGAVRPYVPVIGVAGTHAGADTAIAARSTYTGRLMSPDPSKCFTVMEVIAMPRVKSADSGGRLA